MKRYYMESPSSGVVFMITPSEGQYKIHIRAIPENKGKSYVLVYSRCVKKYHSIKSCNDFIDRFDAKTEEEQTQYVAQFYRGIGNQKKKQRYQDFVAVRAVTKQLFFQDSKGKWRKHDSYSNPKLLERAIRNFERRGKKVVVEHGVARTYKVPKELISDAHELLIIEAKDHTPDMTIGEKKKAQRASFWYNK